MIDTAARFFWQIKQKKIFQIFQRTLTMLMPIAVLGSFFQMLRDVVFAPASLIYNIANFDVIMSDRIWSIGSNICFGMVRVTLGVFGIYAAYFTARYTAEIYHKDAVMSGTTSVIVILFCAYFASLNNGSRSVFFSGVLDSNGVLIALIIGYLVGQIFHFLAPDYHYIEHKSVVDLRRRALKSIKPLLAVTVFGLLLGMTIYLLKFKMLNSDSFKSLVVQLQSSNNILEIVGIDFVCNILSWLGINYPSASLTNITNSGALNANLNYALRHGSSWNVPYRFLGSSLIQSYGSMMGVCFALMLLALWLKRRSYHTKVAELNLLPVTFNINIGFAVSWPLLLNPLFLPVLALLPVINVLLAAGAIALHLIPAPAYPVLTGTPELLIPFFSSNGNWFCLIFSFFLLLVDICLLIPILKISQKIALLTESEADKRA